MLAIRGRWSRGQAAMAAMHSPSWLSGYASRLHVKTGRGALGVPGAALLICDEDVLSQFPTTRDPGVYRGRVRSAFFERG
jgi:hypothetical protein